VTVRADSHIMTCYWHKEAKQCSEDLGKAEILVKMNDRLSWTDLHSYVLYNNDILRAGQSSATLQQQHQQGVKTAEGTTES
jgi:hypothetical protein